ncbi:MAG: hypothetical protein K9M80_03325, partial [Candidatus Marinimicrobia bacterium]|nr:hypothetical protein [Candidatus Neomarinimicrobiota bacterium]
MNALINNRLTNSRKVLYLIFGITFLFNSLYSESDVRYYIQCPNEIIYDRVELKLDSIKTEEKLDNSYCYFSPKKGYYLGARQSDNEKIVRISAKPLVIV